MLSIGHITVDLNPGALPALLPILFLDLKLNYTTAALVITTANLTSSVIQPVFGILADRLANRWLLPLGCFIASVGLGLASQAESYWTLLGWVICSSLGVAMFHPEAAKVAHLFSGTRRGTGMALFIVGGNFGVAFGPVLIGLIIAGWGRPGVLAWMAIGLIFPLMYIVVARRLSDAAVKQSPSSVIQMHESAVKSNVLPNVRRSLSMLLSVIVFRQAAQTGLLTFFPLYLVNQLGGTTEAANQVLSAFLFGGVLGTLAGGPLSDRFGRKPLLALTLLVSSPLFLAAIMTSGIVSLVLYFIAGMILVLTTSITVVMGQDLMPKRTGLASAMTIGLASGIGGIVAAILGRYADVYGIESTIVIVCLLPLPGVVLTYFLTDTFRRARTMTPVAPTA